MARAGKPLVSVVLPVHNGDKTILRAVNSILAQTLANWELVIINDGSTDQTLKRLVNINETRLKVVSLPHSGIAKALNFGLKMARGKYIARMDADDECLPHRLEKQVAFLDQHPHVGLVACQTVHVGSSDQEGYRRHIAWTNELFSPDEIYHARFQDAPFAHPSVMFRKSLFYQYGGYSETNVPEDFELWLRWFHAGIRMQKLPEVLLKWYDPPYRLSRTHPNYTSNLFFEVKAHYFARWYTKKEVKRPIWIFGTGRTVNHRIKPLKVAGIKPEKFIDVVPKTAAHIIHYQDLPEVSERGPFLLSYVSDRKGKKEIKDFLEQRNYQEGTDFIMMA
ncbi:MAG: glycosyltransferase [Bacteroidota bacterium]